MRAVLVTFMSERIYRQTDRHTDHATMSVAIGRICAMRTMRPNNDQLINSDQKQTRNKAAYPCSHRNATASDYLLLATQFYALQYKELCSATYEMHGADP